MQWLRMYKYWILGSVSLLLLAFMFTSSSRVQVPIENNPSVVVTIGRQQLPREPSSLTHPPSAPSNIPLQGEDLPLTIPLPVESAQPRVTDYPGSNTTQGETLLPPEDVAQNKPKVETAEPDTSLLDFVYSLNQYTHMVSPQLTTVPVRTELQQALYEYGNQAGLAMLSFQNSVPNMSVILQKWIDNRANQESQQQVLSIAQNMTRTSDALTNLPSVPDKAAQANAALASSMTDAANKLRAVVSESSNDAALVESMKTYNTAAETFIKKYVALADLFTLHQVTFKDNDPGSAFSFSATGGL